MGEENLWEITWTHIAAQDLRDVYFTMLEISKSDQVAIRTYRSIKKRVGELC